MGHTKVNRLTDDRSCRYLFMRGHARYQLIDVTLPRSGVTIAHGVCLSLLMLKLRPRSAVPNEAA